MNSKQLDLAHFVVDALADIVDAYVEYKQDQYTTRVIKPPVAPQTPPTVKYTVVLSDD